jgi:hypothetical protein
MVEQVERPFTELASRNPSLIGNKTNFTEYILSQKGGYTLGHSFKSTLQEGDRILAEFAKIGVCTAGVRPGATVV